MEKTIIIMITSYKIRVSFRILAKGDQNEMQWNNWRVGQKWYDPPGSKAYDKLWDPRIIICPLIRGMYLKWGILCSEGLHVLLCGAQSACIAC